MKYFLLPQRKSGALSKEAGPRAKTFLPTAPLYKGSGSGGEEGQHSVTRVPLRALTPHFSSGIRQGPSIWWPHGTVFLLWTRVRTWLPAQTEVSFSTEALHGAAACGSHLGLCDSLLAFCLHYMLSLALAEGQSPSTTLLFPINNCLNPLLEQGSTVMAL